MSEVRNQKAAIRPLIPIEKRMMASIKRTLRNDRISVKELNAKTRWDMDGKNFRQLISELGAGPVYAYGFGISSHFVHGDWFDLKTHHLEIANGRYLPRWESGTPDPKIVCAATIVGLLALERFIRWNKSDPFKQVRPVVLRLINFARELYHHHEMSLQMRK